MPVLVLSAEHFSLSFGWLLCLDPGDPEFDRDAI